MHHQPASIPARTAHAGAASSGRLDRRTLLAALSATPLLALLQACGSSDSPATSSTTAGAPTSTAAPGDSGQEVRSGAARRAPDPATALGAARAVNLLGADLYARLAAGNTDNVVFSSASIMYALAMTRAGARGATRTEMDAVLHASETGSTPDGLHGALNALDAALESRSGEFQVESQTLPVELAIANSLWGQDGVVWVPAFLDLLATEYGAGLRVVDYTSDPEAARSAINNWVAGRTNRRIPELLAPGTITPGVMLTLVNAIYLKAPWLSPFPEAATKDRPFTNADGSSVLVPVMSATIDATYSRGDGWQAVDLAYVGNSLTMTLIVPDAGSLTEIESRLPSGLLDTLTSSLAPREVVLDLPRFDIETRVELATVMAALGMPTAFDPDRADFSGMTADEKLFIDLIIHQANITVDEKGTEAAAATAVVMRTTSANTEPPVNLSIDRPFLYAVRDIPTGAVLFLGRVSRLG